MATNVTLNGVVYSIPAEGDSGWGTVLSNFFISTAANTLQKTGGNFTLLADVNFGASFGLKTIYVKTPAANPSASGFLRLGNSEAIGWRNAANSGDVTLSVDASNNLNFNGSSLTLNGNPVQGQISVGDTSTIDLTFTANNITADVLAGSLTNAHINAAAAIAFTKLASLSAGKALQSNASTGVIEVSAVTTSELGFLSGVTSAVQTQLNAKADSSTAVTLAGAQTLTNKTITAPLGIVKGDIGLGNVDNTSDATKNAAVATLTNKSINGTNNPITNVSLTTGVTGTLPLANGGTNNAALSVTGGTVYYADGTKLVGLANGTAGQCLRSSGTTVAPTWANPTIALTAPKITVYNSGSGAWTRTGSPIYLRVRMVGAGGGGGGSGTGGSGSAGTAGGISTFGTSFLTANGGGAGGGANGGGGGTVTVNAGADGASGIGGSGQAIDYNAIANSAGGNGGASFFGGGGNGSAAIAGTAGTTGAGGGGAGIAVAGIAGSGGGAGAYIDVIVPTPSTSYSYAVGAAGSAGAAGTSGLAGGAGGSGYIEVTEYYQ